MKTDLYLIKNLTNLHVGSGDINFDIVDNQVQKDNITNLPIIHSSSLKGAFREHFDKKGSSFTTYIFGSSPTENDTKNGAFSFFEAKLLTRPVRSNIKPYYNATSPEIIKELIDSIETLDIKVEFLEELKEFYEDIKNISKPTVLDNKENVILEDYKAERKNISINIPFLKDIAIFPYKDFQKLELPVIARNHLEDGASQNLWYEEVVPKYSQFYFFIAKPTNVDESDKEKIKQFERSFDNENIIQIGANKSIGYGYCKIERVSK